MKKLLLVLSLLVLAGCCTPQEVVKPSVVVQYKYVVSPLPKEVLVVPEKVAPIDLKTATQKDAADWLARSEGRTNDLEAKLKNIAKIQDDQVKAEGQK